MGKLSWRVLIKFYFIPVICTTVPLYVALTALPSNEFPLDNARYFYSAVFQGFAALLALTLTAILVIFQNMNSQRSNIEGRIYKILDKRFPTYFFDSIEGIKQDMQNKSFNTEFTACVKENTKFSPEDQVLLVKRITGELNNMFNYLDSWKEHKSGLYMLFVLSALLSMSVLFSSAIALIFVDSDNVFGVNPFCILFVVSSLVLIALIIFAVYFFKIIKTWKIHA